MQFKRDISTRGGEGIFTDKDKAFLIDKSRESVEGFTNTSVLLFKPDWVKSQKNFYGECTIMYFTNSKGIQLEGIITIDAPEVQHVQTIPNQSTNLIFQVYTERLNELGVEILLGDYLGVKNKLYYIYDSIPLDSNKNSIGVFGEAYYFEFKGYQADGETLFPDFYGDDSFGLQTSLIPGLNNKLR